MKSQGSCFELFGYDFIVDGDMGIWLIEVNTNPCLEESSQLLCKYVPRMVNDMLRITVDQVFHQGKKAYTENVCKFNIPQYSNEENLWEPMNIQLEHTLTATTDKLQKKATIN